MSSCACRLMPLQTGEGESLPILEKRETYESYIPCRTLLIQVLCMIIPVFTCFTSPKSISFRLMRPCHSE